MLTPKSAQLHLNNSSHGGGVKGPNDRSRRQSLDVEDVVDMLDRLVEDIMKASEYDSESESVSGGESKALAQSMAPVQRLSILDLSRTKVVNENEARRSSVWSTKKNLI